MAGSNPTHKIETPLLKQGCFYLRKREDQGFARDWIARSLTRTSPHPDPRLGHLRFPTSLRSCLPDTGCDWFESNPQNRNTPAKAGVFLFAEAGGFEPPIPFRVYRISSAAHSTTLARFHWAFPSVTKRAAPRKAELLFYPSSHRCEARYIAINLTSWHP